ncbi:hypothetical protein B7463_g10436, partial [Scytalidium lignicola]
MATTTTTSEGLDENYWCAKNKINGNFGSEILSDDAIVGDFDSLPLIDIAGIFSDDLEERKKVAAQLREACTKVGFFYIENHGIPQEDIDTVFNMGKKFFELPFDEKMEVYINNTPHYRGYTPLYGGGSAGPDGKGNANEAFDWGHDSKLNDDPEDKFIDPHMRGENPWPRQIPEFEQVLSNYYRRLRNLGRVFAQNIALSLGLDESYFDPYLTHPGCSALVAHYPPQEVGSKKFGIDGHTDAELVTFLAPGDVRALEVLNRNGYWVSAPPKKGCYIVNVGDQLQSFTNGLYVSTMHRVLNYSGQERYSIPFFFSCNFETVIKVLSGWELT